MLKTSPEPRPKLRILTDCLEPIAEALEHLTANCWTAYPGHKDRPGDEQRPWFLRVSEFRRDPHFAVGSLYRGYHLDQALTGIAVHHTQALADEIKDRLMVPLQEMAAVEFAALKELHGYAEADNPCELLRVPYALDELKLVGKHCPEDGDRRRKIITILDGWADCRNKFRAAAGYLRNVVGAIRSKTTTGSGTESEANGKQHGKRKKLKPRWDAERRELWYGPRLLKRYRRPAPRQWLILDVFQESNWPVRVDDPCDPGCLHDTLKHLNGTLPDDTPIRFASDGEGRGILWEAT